MRGDPHLALKIEFSRRPLALEGQVPVVPAPLPFERDCKQRIGDDESWSEFVEGRPHAYLAGKRVCIT